MRKGIFIPDITVEMFRNASLEAVEELLVSGEMQDIDLADEQNGFAKGYNEAKREIALSGEYERAYQRGYEDGRKEEWTMAMEEIEKVR